MRGRHLSGECEFICLAHVLFYPPLTLLGDAWFAVVFAKTIQKYLDMLKQFVFHLSFLSQKG